MRQNLMDVQKENIYKNIILKKEDSLEVKQLRKALKETQLEFEILKKSHSCLFQYRCASFTASVMS